MKKILTMVATLCVAASLPTAASAHTTNIGYTLGNDGSVTFYAGHYHSEVASNLPNTYGGLRILTSPDNNNIGTYNFTDHIVGGTQPAFVEEEVAPGVSPGLLPPDFWQVVTVQGLAQGNYSISTTNTTVVEHPWPNHTWTFDINPINAVPEPATAGMLAMGALCMTGMVRRRRRR